MTYRLLLLLLLFYVTLLAVFHVDTPREVDTAWMVQVCMRMRNGETLYRDIFCGTTPLAFVVQSFGMRFVADGFLLIRITVHALFAITVLCGAATARTLGIRWTSIVAGVALLSLWITPLPGSLYSWWALAFAMAAQWVLVEWSVCGFSQRLAAVAGVLAGLAFCSKPNVGILVLAALCVSMMLICRLAGWRSVVFAAVGFAAVAGACLAAIASAGMWDQFIVQCVTGKAVYVSQAGLRYQDFLKGALVPQSDALAWLKSTLYLMPFCLVFLWFGRGEKSSITILGLFALAGLAAVYPRPDEDHMMLAAPLLALAAAWLFDRFMPYRLPLLAGVLTCTMMRALAIAKSESPPNAAVLVPITRVLESHAQDGKLFLLFRSASLFYPMANFRNPTRYDYPLASPFGLHGQQDVIEQIEAGAIPVVCMGRVSEDWMNLAPEKLMNYVETSMKAGADVGVCRIYTAVRP